MECGSMVHTFMTYFLALDELPMLTGPSDASIG